MFHKALPTKHFTKGDEGVSLSQGRENIIKSKLYVWKATLKKMPSRSLECSASYGNSFSTKKIKIKIKASYGNKTKWVIHLCKTKLF